MTKRQFLTVTIGTYSTLSASDSPFDGSLSARSAVSLSRLEKTMSSRQRSPLPSNCQLGRKGSRKGSHTEYNLAKAPLTERE